MNNFFGVKNHDDFPLDALPPLLRNTLLEVERKIHSPIGLIASSMLSTMAIACQGAFNIRTPVGEVVPSSLFIVTVAESGERKTATDNLFIQSIRDFEVTQRKHHLHELKVYQSKEIVWNIHKQELEKSLRQGIREGYEIESIREELENLLRNEPVPPLQTRLLYSDTTSEFLLKNLSHQWPSGAIHSSEGLSVFSGRAFHKLGPLNELWDGTSSITVDRLHADSYELTDARLSVSLMLQLQPFIDFLSKKNNLAVNAGLTSRFLICMPTSTQGSRNVEKQSQEGSGSGYISALQQFKEKLQYWLKISEERTFSGAPFLEFTFEEDAEHQYLEMLSTIEAEIAPQKYLEHHGALASKLGNNLARLAGLIQSFDEKSNIITLKSLNSAWDLIAWYTDQHIKFIRISQNQISDDDMGDMLYDWLRSHVSTNGGYLFKVTPLYRNVPGSIRGKEKVQRAISNLESRNLLVNHRQHRPATIFLVMKPTAQQSFAPSHPQATSPVVTGWTDLAQPFDPATSTRQYRP